MHPTPHSPSASSRRARPAATRNAGFTLVEVLVSLVVLSIGLLGMAKLVMVSSHANDSAYMRSQATALGYQLLDNMRANYLGAQAGSYTTALYAVPGAVTPCNGTATCSTTQTAQWDVYSWKQTLATALPAGTGSVVTSTSPPYTATIQVQWDDAAAQLAFNAASAVGTPAQMTVTLQTVME